MWFRKDILFEDIETDKDFERWVKQGKMNWFQESWYYFKMHWRMKLGNTIGAALDRGDPIAFWILSHQMYVEPYDHPCGGPYKTEAEAVKASIEMGDEYHLCPHPVFEKRRNGMKRFLLLLTLLCAFVVFQAQAEGLGIGAEIVDPEAVEEVVITLSTQPDTSEINLAAICAAVTGLVATQLDDNSVKLSFLETSWWSQFTTERLTTMHKAQLKEAAEEDWAAVWPLIIEANSECLELQAELSAI